MAPSTRTLDREIAALAIPAALALATDPLYDLCDTAILGHIGTPQLAGAALASRLLAFGYAAFVFLMFGTTAAVARHRGAGDERASAEQAVAAVWIALVLGVLAAAVFAVTGRSLIGALGGRGEVARHAWTYLWVSLAGMPAFTTVMAGVGFLRGRGDTRTPLAVAAASVTLNLVLEIVLVFGLHRGVGASAFGTVVAKWVGALVYVTVIVRSARAQRASWRPRFGVLRGQLLVGRDLVIRTTLLLGVLAAAQTLAARIGVDALAAHAIAFQLWIFAAYATDGLEAAGQTLIAHRLGAGRRAEVVAVARRLIVWAARLGLGFGVVVLATSRLTPHVFTSDPAVIAAASTTLVWVALLQPVNAVAFALDGVLVGASEQGYLAVAMAVATVVFAIAAFGAHGLDAGLNGVWAAISAFMITRCAAAVWRLRSIGAAA
ncbi:MAG: MATE family efflux transporter [Acidimicrobiales bacterium]